MMQLVVAVIGAVALLLLIYLGRVLFEEDNI